MTKFATNMLPEMQKILEDNGIDVNRCIDASVRHCPKDGFTEITVTLLALKPEDRS
jgi:hypothetical protein